MGVGVRVVLGLGCVWVGVRVGIGGGRDLEGFNLVLEFLGGLGA